MVDIRTIRGKDKTDAFAKARVEFGGNFVILTSKDIKVGGFLGLGMKTEHELRIMLNNSIYDRKNSSMNNEEKSYSDDDGEMHRSKLLSDRIEMKKHSSETIDASEMADRIVSITKALKEKSASRNNSFSSNNNTSRSSVQENSYTTENEDIPEELLNDSSTNNTAKANVIEEKIEDNSAREKSVDNFIPLPNFSNNQYSNLQGSTFANMRNPMLSDYSANNSFSPINNYSNFTANNNIPNNNIPNNSFMNNSMNNFNNNVMYNHTNSSNNNQNNINQNNNNSVDDNVKKLVQEQIRDIIKEYLETNIPNINLNKNNSNNSNINEDSKYQNKTSYSTASDEEDEIKNAIEEIKESRREQRGIRERKELKEHRSEVQKTDKEKRRSQGICKSRQQKLQKTDCQNAKEQKESLHQTLRTEGLKQKGSYPITRKISFHHRHKPDDYCLK